MKGFLCLRFGRLIFERAYFVVFVVVVVVVLFFLGGGLIIGILRYYKIPQTRSQQKKTASPQF